MKVKTYSAAEKRKEIKNSVRNAREDIAKEVRLNAIDFMMHLAVWAVWDTIPNISKKRLKKILEFMCEKTTFIIDGTVTLDDIKQMIKDETGITIGFKGE